MRQFIFGILIFMVIGTIWMLYLNYSDKKFLHSLPKAPPVKSEAERPSKARNEVLEQEEPPASLPSESDVQEQTPGPSAAESHTEQLYQGQVSEIIEEPIDLASQVPEISADDPIDLYTAKPWLKPISEMSLAEIKAEVKRSREALINEFGNTPEVALINKYTTVDSLRDGRVTLEDGDAVAYIRAISVLWPVEHNIQLSKEFERMAGNGWHVNPQSYLENVPGLE